jgi:hypothetical protein
MKIDFVELKAHRHCGERSDDPSRIASSHIQHTKIDRTGNNRIFPGTLTGLETLLGFST